MTLQEHLVQVGGVTYLVIDDVTATRQAFVVGRAVDELDGTPPEAVAVSAALRGITPGAPGEGERFAPVAGRDGTFAVTGEATSAFPGLGTTSYVVDVTVSSDGYLPAPLAIGVPAGSSFPLAGVIASLHRPGVWLTGRVTDAVGAALAAAQVAITDPPGLVGLQWPLDFQHAPGTPVAPATLAPSGPPLVLLDGAAAMDTRLHLDHRLNLAPGSLVEAGSSVYREYAVVDHLDGPPTLSRPGWAVLRAPLHAGYPAGATVQPLGSASGLATVISREAVPGDQVLVFAAATTLATGGVVEITDTDPTRIEYRVALLPISTTDGLGFYRLGPTSRTAAPNLHVVAPAHSPVDVTWLVDYDRLENVRNVRVP